MELLITQNRQDLEQFESIIRKGQKTFYEVGRALKEIRDRRLYCEVLGYKTFEEYCRERWEFERRHAYRLIDSAGVVEIVSHGTQIPVNERQVRPLTKLEPEQQKEAWQKAIETAPEGKVTAAHVYKIVKDMNQQQEETKEGTGGEEQTRKRPVATEAMQFAVIAISQLERIRGDDPRKIDALKRVLTWIENRLKG